MSSEKTCITCKETKPITEFYWNKNYHTYITECKVCQRARVKKRVGYYLEYSRSEEGRKRRVAASKRSREKSPEKWDARIKLRRAVKLGEVKKLPCEVCDEVSVHAHHHLGYEGENVYKVRWLCIPHHKEAHREMKKVDSNLQQG